MVRKETSGNSPLNLRSVIFRRRALEEDGGEAAKRLVVKVQILDALLLLPRLDEQRNPDGSILGIELVRAEAPAGIFWMRLAAWSRISHAFDMARRFSLHLPAMPRR